MTPKTIEEISFTPQICENIRISITPADFARCVLDYIVTKLCVVCNNYERFIKKNILNANTHQNEMNN